jgi:prepilin-type N-terminal cleavage/methylation domain-containing protein
MRAADRAGFTLIELLVALVLSVAIVVGARGLLEGLAEQTGRLVGATARTDSIAATRWSYHHAVANIALPSGDSLVFEGTGTTARFVGWCPVAGGWEERCQVVLSTSPDGAAGARLTFSTGDAFLLGAGSRTVMLYLVSPLDGGSWTTEWHSTIAPPAGVAIIAGRDTLFAPTGDLR